MKKTQRILAMIGVILLISLYIVTLISAFLATPYSSALFKSCIYSTIVIPILLYVYIMLYKLLKKDDENKE